MVAAVIPLHQSFGPNQLQFWVESLGRCIIWVANSSIADIGGIGFAKSLRPETLSAFCFYCLFCIFNNLISYNMLPEAVLEFFDLSFESGKVILGKFLRISQP